MALNIENATIGYNANEVQNALNNLNTKCIEDTKSTMRTRMSDLRSTVDAGWVGASADQFKKNMEADKDRICAALDEAFGILKGELTEIVNKMSEMDKSLIAKRGN
ncbi:MAG: hypothetical protein IJO63_05665 [Bacilli bacterium]|nr:hypothetical protein [Bacilli bacterium]